MEKDAITKTHKSHELIQAQTNKSWNNFCQDCNQNTEALVESLTGKAQAGSSAEGGAPRVGGRALVDASVLVLVQVANDQTTPRHVTPVVIPQINDCSV